MRPWLLLNVIASAAAFQDTSPFILVSNNRPLEELPSGGSHEFSVDWIESAIMLKALESCPYKAYVFVNQPEVSEREITKKNTPFLEHIVSSSKSRELFATVKDSAKYQGLAEGWVREYCDVTHIEVDPETGMYEHYVDAGARIVTLDFPDADDLTKNDEVLKRAVSGLASGDFFLSYRTTPKIKDVSIDKPESKGPIEEKKYQSLFQNYTYFSPAIFMGTIVAGLVVSVLFLALNAVNSLAITPKAFEKPPSSKN